MKNRLNTLNSFPFLICLGLLILNDFYLKAEFHNWATGKLSDFCGLYVFVVFWSTIFPKKKLGIHLLVAFLFVLWKSPYSQSFIDFFSQHLYPISRVVDFSDFLALAVLPISYFFHVERVSLRLRLNPYVVSVITIMSFCATSMPAYYQKFEQPQYLLFKNTVGLLDIDSGRVDFDLYQFDTAVIVAVDNVFLGKPVLSDEYQKVQVLKKIEQYIIGNEDFRHSKKEMGTTESQKRVQYILARDSFKDELHFKGSRLHGRFRRFSKNDKLVIEGYYQNGIEDSVWNYYDKIGEVVMTKYFEEGELVKTENFSNSKLVSAIKTRTRAETIRNKSFHLAILGLLMLFLIYLIVSNYRKSDGHNIKVSHFLKISESMIFPIGAYLLARLISLAIPNSGQLDFPFYISLGALFYIVSVPVFLFILYTIKLRKPIDLLLYVLLFAFGLVFFEQAVYLGNIWY